MDAPAMMLLAVALALALAVPRASADTYRRAYVTAYSTTEALTGCSSPGRCRTACGGLLDDRRYTVAANPRLGLGCGARIVVCGGYVPRVSPQPRGPARCHAAVVNDRTASAFDFELSFALAIATGASRAGWDSPRWVRWRPR